jgi:stage V sporulation protein B
MSDDGKHQPAGGPRADSAPRPVGAGKGLLFISAAKLWFVIAGYAIQFALPRALGSPAKYGAWGVVLACVSLFNNVMVTGTIQGVSRYVAQIPERAAAVVRAALGRQLIGGGIVAGLFILGAPFVAGGILHDPAYTAYLRVAGIITFCYAMYAVFVGAANGLRQFHKQAGLDMAFATLRASAVIGAALVTHSVLASIAGFAGAAVVILLVAMAWVGVGPRRPPPHDHFAVGELERYFARVAAYLVLVNLLMFIDGILLKRLVTVAAERAGAVQAAQLGDTQAGLYNAVQTIARLPYQLILTVTFVIFPMMSRATFDEDAERARRYVVVTMRYSLLVVGLMATALASRPAATLGLLFPADYQVAAPALPILVAGYVAFSLFNILGTILNAAGETGASLRTGAITVVVCLASVWLALGWALPRGLQPGLAAAIATASSMLVGLLLAARDVHRRFGGVLSPASALRVVAAVGAGAAVGRFWPTSGFLGGKLGTLVSLAVIGLAYLVVVSPDLRPSELRRLREETRG